MKEFWKGLPLAVFLGVVFPWVALCIARETVRWPQPEQTQEQQEQQEQLQQPYQQTVRVLHGDTVKEMKLSDYLTGVLLGEIPGSFHMEAKKAQAVVARTYTLRTVTVKDKHPGGAICTDSACCQAYCSPESYLAAGGSMETVTQAAQAVSQTENTVLRYAGELIDATYFSCSGGKTEDAVAVWGSDIPYLQSVESPGEEQAEHYTDTVIFTEDEFREALGTDLSGSCATWFGRCTYTDGGGVDTLEIGDTVYRGTQLRQLLGLRSTAFSVSAVGTDVVITTRGFGHRVGMSQYGAQAMAHSGSSWEQILLHYYPGTVIDKGENMG